MKISSNKVALLLLPFVAVGIFHVINSRPKDAEATGYGGLLVETGVAKNKPIFTVEDFKPGDCETRKIKVKNTTTKKKELTVRSENVSETKNLSSALTIKIENGQKAIYENSLRQFFEDSGTLDGIILGSIDKNSTKEYFFEVCFNIDAGNEFQRSLVEFDLLFGDVISPIKLPEECSHLTGKVSSVITGTNGNDRINGTSASELILGFEGDNRIDGGAGNDCIVVGNGNNRIDGGSGNDVIITGNGSNRLFGGAGNDTIHTGSGNDRIEGGSGNDIVYAGGGDDRVNGDSGDDYLDGGEGFDRLNGNAGTDTCVNAEIKTSCEL